MEWNDIFISTVLWISLRCECIMQSFWAWHRCLLIPELPAFVKAESNKYQERKTTTFLYMFLVADRIWTVKAEKTDE